MSLLKKFSKILGVPTQDDSADVLTKSSKIGTVLKQLKDEKVLLKVHFPDSTEFYSSVILDVDAKNNRFFMDELHPQEGHQLFIKTQSIMVQGHTKSALLSYKIEKGEVRKSKGFVHYELPFPSRLKYIQRRSSFRTQVDSRIRLTVSVYVPSTKDMAMGFVEDISATGMRVRFTSGSGFHRGDELELCSITTPDGMRLTFTFEVRYTGRAIGNGVVVGGRFKDTNTKTKRGLQKLASDIQRMAIKQRNHLK